MIAIDKLKQYQKTILCLIAIFVLFAAPTALEAIGYPLPVGTTKSALSATQKCYGLGAILLLLVLPAFAWYEYDNVKKMELARAETAGK